MKWKLLNKLNENSKKGDIYDQIIDLLLENRNIKDKKSFLSPSNPADLNFDDVGIDKKLASKAVARIIEAINHQEPIVVYGDYDVDGICSTTILWETLNSLKAKVMPYIPLREKEGYGLSIEGIKAIIADEKYNLPANKTIKTNETKTSNTKNQGLIISVDSGIVAFDAVDHANDLGLDVIILDHHEAGNRLPKAHAIVHTKSLCAGGISFFFSRFLKVTITGIDKVADEKEHLGLAAIATVADLVPLIGANRSIVKFGLEVLNQTQRVGLLALYEVAGIKKVGTYEIGYQIGPRINASGRIENALVALRLLCTSNLQKAKEYATALNEINKERQAMLEEMVVQAFEIYESTKGKDEKIIILESADFHQGIIGLIAGKMVEKYYLPTIVISKGETHSKASARSISGFDIISSIREVSHLLLGAGGHSMAAGFSIETIQIQSFKESMGKLAKEKVLPEMLEKELKIDLQISPEDVDLEKLLQKIDQFAPFGMGNPEPVFESEFEIMNSKTMGATGKHVRLDLVSFPSGKHFEAVGFNMADRVAHMIKPGETIAVAYNVDINNYMGRRDIQLMLKDVNRCGLNHEP